MFQDLENRAIQRNPNLFGRNDQIIEVPRFDRRIRRPRPPCHPVHHCIACLYCSSSSSSSSALSPSIQSSIRFVDVVFILFSIFPLFILDFSPRTNNNLEGLFLEVYTEEKIKVCTRFREISSCSCLTALPGPAWVLLSKTYKPLSYPL